MDLKFNSALFRIRSHFNATTSIKSKPQGSRPRLHISGLETVSRTRPRCRDAITGYHYIITQYMIWFQKVAFTVSLQLNI